MSKVRVKICGIQPGDNLDFTKDSLISHVGFVFEKASSRHVSPEVARKIISQIDSTCEPVGVFRHADASLITEICEVANIKTVQLHGNEPPEACFLLRTLGFKVWKSISIPVSAVNPEIVLDKARQYANVVDAILLDSSVRKNGNCVIEGGSGVSFSWTLLGGQAGLIARLKPANVWIAGGIKPENAAMLLDICNPFGVDVSSGVEREGRKSMDRITELLKVVSSSESSYPDAG
jgi:phosphoribosylanthranilate isomerase